MPLTHPLAQPLASDPGDVPDLRMSVRPGAPPVVEVSGEVHIRSASWLRDGLLRSPAGHANINEELAAAARAQIATLAAGEKSDSRANA